MEGNYAYTLNADDFYHMMMDNIEATRTASYRITNVRREGSQAEVFAQHDYVAPSGITATIYHHYRLARDRNGYYITDFMSSSDPIGDY
jgi:hypothetical protein